MKYLGYIAIILDLMLGNSHYIYLLSSASDEWYVSDVCVSIRIILWIFVALFWMKNGNSKAEQFTVGWYGLCASWDVLQTISKSNGSNPTLEIIIFMAGASLIQLYSHTHGSKKESKYSDKD